MGLYTGTTQSAETYERLGEALKVYDVDQEQWEHEGKGIEFNAKHVLGELTRARRKSMLEPRVVRTELAPDAAQYALRLKRWADLPTGLILPREGEGVKAHAHAYENEYSRDRIGGWMLAEISLSQDFTHRLDHPSERSDALARMQPSLGQVSRYLLYFAETSATEFDFDLETSFMNRLADLRERFGVAEPEGL